VVVFLGFGQIATGRNPNSDFYNIRVISRGLEFVYIRNWDLDCTARFQLFLEVGIVGSVAFVLSFHIESARLDFGECFLLRTKRSFE
jgi:hypothetical protein